MDRGWRNTALAIAPSGSLCWGLALGQLGPAAGFAGAAGGAAVAVLGGWLLARQAERASVGGGVARWLPPGLTLVLLFVVLVLVPSVVRVGMWRGLPPL